MAVSHFHSGSLCQQCDTSSCVCILVHRYLHMVIHAIAVTGVALISSCMLKILCHHRIEDADVIIFLCHPLTFKMEGVISMHLYICTFYIASCGSDQLPISQLPSWCAPPRGRLDIKISSYQYRDSHYKDKTVSRPSYLHNENLHTWKDSLYFKTEPYYPQSVIDLSFLVQTFIPHSSSL